jgi:hypothetical protein
MSPDKFDVKSVLGEIKKMNRRFSFSKCDLVIGIITLFVLLTLKLFHLYIAVSYCYLRTSYKIFFNIFKLCQIHIPIVKDHHWMVLCINLLFKKINLLDSLQGSVKLAKSTLVCNMVIFNFVFFVLLMITILFFELTSVFQCYVPGGKF